MHRFILSCEARTPAADVRNAIQHELEQDQGQDKDVVWPALEIDRDFSPAIPIGDREVDVTPTSDALGVTFRPATETISAMVRQILQQRSGERE